MKTAHKINLLLAIAVVSLLLFNLLPEENGYLPLTNTSQADVTSIQLVSKQRHLILSRLNNNWVLQDQPDKAIKQDVVEKLLGILQTHSYRQFENTAENRNAFSLDQPAYKIIIDDLQILYGTTEPAQQLRYVLIGDRIHLITDLYLQYLLADRQFFLRP